VQYLLSLMWRDLETVNLRQLDTWVDQGAVRAKEKPISPERINGILHLPRHMAVGEIEAKVGKLNAKADKLVYQGFIVRRS